MTGNTQLTKSGATLGRHLFSHFYSLPAITTMPRLILMQNILPLSDEWGYCYCLCFTARVYKHFPCQAHIPPRSIFLVDPGPAKRRAFLNDLNVACRYAGRDPGLLHLNPSVSGVFLN